MSTAVQGSMWHTGDTICVERCKTGTCWRREKSEGMQGAKGYISHLCACWTGAKERAEAGERKYPLMHEEEGDASREGSALEERHKAQWTIKENISR